MKRGYRTAVKLAEADTFTGDRVGVYGMAAAGGTGSSVFVKFVKRCLLGREPVSTYDISRLADQAPISLENKKHLITIGTGRCGMRWLTRFFSQHHNCVGSAERFMDYDAFYRWATWYGIEVDMSGYFELMRRAAYADLRDAEVTIYTGHYLVFALEKACREFRKWGIGIKIRGPVALSVPGLYGIISAFGWHLHSLQAITATPTIIPTN